MLDVSPRVSIVITWRRDVAVLGDALRVQLSRRRPVRDVDLIVVTTETPDGETIDSFSDVRFITASADASVERLRRIGMEHAHGDIVMLLDGTIDGDLIERAGEIGT